MTVPATEVRRRWVGPAAIALAVLPSVISAVYGIANQRWVTGDRSIMGLFTRDVFSRNPPLLGTVSTLGNYTDGGQGEAVHHLGPAQFYALALPDWVASGHPAGLLIGGLLINALAIALIVHGTRRRLGDVGGAVMAVVVVGTSFGLGPALLRDIWTPHLGLWPLLALLVLTWGLLEGDLWALPWAAGAASFLAQIELLFVGPAFVLVLVGIGGLLRDRWVRMGPLLLAVDPDPVEPETDEIRAETDELWVAAPATDAVPEERSDVDPDEERSRATGPSLGRATMWAAVVSAVVWLPVAIQEATGRPGNLSLLIESLGSQDERVPTSFVWGNLVALLQLPPIWLRRAESPFDIGAGVGAIGTLSAALTLGVLVVLTVRALQGRSGPRTVATLLLVAWAGIAGGAFNLFITPEAGAIGLQYRRWMWPVGAFVWFGIATALSFEVGTRLAERRQTDRRWPLHPAVATGALAVALIGVLPAAFDQDAPPLESVETRRSIESVWDGVHDDLPPQPTLVELVGADAAFAIGPEVIRRLVVHGWEVRVPAYFSTAFGEHRVHTPDRPVAQTLQLVTDESSLAPSTPPVRLLAAGRPGGGSDDGFLRRTQELLDRVRGGEPFALSADGRAALLEELRASPAPDVVIDRLLVDPTQTMFDVRVLQLQVDGLLDASPLAAEDAAWLLAELREIEVLGFLLPAPGDPAPVAE